MAPQWGMEEQTGSPKPGRLLGDKMEPMTGSNYNVRNLKNISLKKLSERSQTKKYTAHDTIYVKFVEKCNGSVVTERSLQLLQAWDRSLPKRQRTLLGTEEATVVLEGGDVLTGVLGSKLIKRPLQGWVDSFYGAWPFPPQTEGCRHPAPGDSIAPFSRSFAPLPGPSHTLVLLPPNFILFVVVTCGIRDLC